MEKYLNTPIKEVITAFPGVGKILEEYNIGCVPCSLGSCLLKDIVAIHNLSEEQQAELMHRIEETIYPGRSVKRAVFSQPEKKSPPKEIKYSPPIKRLVDEHTLIKKYLALLPAVIKSADPATQPGKQLILEGLDFIRFYADKFHHAKEEDILFEYTDKNLDIIKTILTDHEAARGHVRAAGEAVKINDRDAIAQHLNAYKELLSEHIKKEDEILYPWIDRGLSTAQVGELFARFNEAEAKMNKEVVEKCVRFVLEAEQRIEQIKTKKEGVK